jgi:hypothetical protein
MRNWKHAVMRTSAQGVRAVREWVEPSIDSQRGLVVCRIADLQSADRPKRPALGLLRRLPITNRRYSRLKTCATRFRFMGEAAASGVPTISSVGRLTVVPQD